MVVRQQLHRCLCWWWRRCKPETAVATPTGSNRTGAPGGNGAIIFNYRSPVSYAGCGGGGGSSHIVIKKEVGLEHWWHRWFSRDGSNTCRCLLGQQTQVAEVVELFSSSSFNGGGAGGSGIVVIRYKFQ